MMKIGIIGLPQVGKTTLFNVLSGQHVHTGIHGAESHLGIIPVPDQRLDDVGALFAPRKVIPAQVEFVDAGGLGTKPGKHTSAEEAHLVALRNTDALVHIVRLFENPKVPHIAETLNPVRDIDQINTELILIDLEIIERRLEKIEPGLLKLPKLEQAEKAKEIKSLHQLKSALEQGKFINQVSLTEEEQKFIRGYCFLTAKPSFLVANIDEHQLGEPPNDLLQQVQKYATEKNYKWIEVSANTEMELISMAESEANEFMQELGIKTLARDQVIVTAYQLCNLISFFTIGKDEVKAWTIRQGTNAVHAAGTIHTDFEKGFIKAEVIHYAALISTGSMAEAKHKGLVRLEGKEYIVKDGDIIQFRFQV
ncbi:MAG: redox-regulated ATPase YchF [bacterium]|nr:redox-regulated ATPase YchF [bacterium]